MPTGSSLLFLRVVLTFDHCCTVFHASELPLLFGPIPNAVETDFANQMLGFYINFVHDLNPGGNYLQLSSFCASAKRWTAQWPQYTKAGKQVLQLMRGNITAIPDGVSTRCYMVFISLSRMIDFDVDKTDFVNSARVLAEFQK